MNTFLPKILAFLCNWCSYAGADLAGVSRFQYPPTIRVIRTMCSGRVDPQYMVEGLSSGYDSVLVFGCHIGDCHYLDGNLYTVRRVEVVRQLLDLAGIGAERVQLRWVSAAEGQMFADYVKELSQLTTDMGPFDATRQKLPLAAVKGALKSQRLRWLMGIDRQITERENVYHEKIDQGEFKKLLKSAVEVEYHKALIMEALTEGPLSVPELNAKTGLPVYTISCRLGDLEKSGSADFYSYEGVDPKFVRLASRLDN